MLIMVEAAMKLEFWKFKLAHIQRNIVYINEIISAVIFFSVIFLRSINCVDEIVSEWQEL